MFKQRIHHVMNEKVHLVSKRSKTVYGRRQSTFRVHIFFFIILGCFIGFLIFFKIKLILVRLLYQKLFNQGPIKVLLLRNRKNNTYTGLTQKQPFYYIFWIVLQ